MREKCYFGVLAVMLLAAGGCRREPVPEMPPPADEVMVSAGAAQVAYPTAGPAVPAGPVDAGGVAADPVPDVVLPVSGPGGGVVVDVEGKVIDQLIEKPREAGIEPEPAPPGVFPPGGP